MQKKSEPQYKDRTTPHIIAMYVLIVVLAGILITTSFGKRGATMDDGGAWQCVQVSCAKQVDPAVWVSENCEMTLDEQDNPIQACNVNIDGQTVTVPLDAINLTFVGQQCAEFACAQEVRTRQVNYSVNVGPDGSLLPR